MKKVLLCSCISLCCLVGGYFIGRFATKKRIKSCGNLRLDHSEPDEPMKIFFEVSDEKSLMSAEYVTLKVVKENYLRVKNSYFSRKHNLRRKLIMKKESLEQEMELLSSNLGNFEGKANSEEYKATLSALDRESKILDTITKNLSEEAKSNLDQKRYENDVKFKDKQHRLDLKRLNQEQRLNDEKLAFEKDKFQKESAIKVKELQLKEKSDKTHLILEVLGITLPIVGTIVTNVIAMRFYNKLAVRALNMEYIDNSITPRSYNECMSNIQKFVSKK